MSTTETVVIPTNITINKPVRIFGQAGVMISYDPMLEYYVNNEMKHTKAFDYRFFSMGINKNTGTCRLSGKFIADLLPEEFNELVMLPSQPWKNGGGS